MRKFGEVAGYVHLLDCDDYFISHQIVKASEMIHLNVFSLVHVNFISIKLFKKNTRGRGVIIFFFKGKI